MVVGEQTVGGGGGGHGGGQTVWGGGDQYMAVYGNSQQYRLGHLWLNSGPTSMMLALCCTRAPYDVNVGAGMYQTL